MSQEHHYGLPVVVVLALIAVIASDYCRPFPTQNNHLTFQLPNPFNPTCYVASFKPEAPEFRTTTSTSSSVSPSAFAANATLTTTTLSPSPSPSFEANL